MKALILAAGYATRLYPLTKEYPKPLLRVGNIPIINYIIGKLEKVDIIDEIIVITNSKFISKFRRWAKGITSNKRINLVDDLTKSNSDRRGAIGDIGFAIDNKPVKDDLLVIGGDNLFDSDLKDFLSFAQANKPYPVLGAYHIKDLQEAKKYGVIKIDRKNRLVNFQEKPENPKSKLVAMCLYYFPKESLRWIKRYLDNKTAKIDATGFYIDWLRRKSLIYVFVFAGSWYDIGDHHFYSEAKRIFNGKHGK